MEKILVGLALCVASSGAFAIPTSTSVTFGNVDPSTLSSTQFNKYDGSVFIKTSDGTADGTVESVWHYSIKNDKWIKVPSANTFNKPLTADFSSTIVTRANVGDWSFPVKAGKSYRVEVVASYQSAMASTTGGSLGFVLPTGAGNIHGFVEGDIANTTVATTLRTPIRAINATNTTAGSFITTTGVGAINSPHSIHSVLTFNCTTSGTFQVQWATEVAASASRLNAGSTLFVSEF